MKKLQLLLALLLAAPLLLPAQDNKPTKEQTIAFVKQWFEDWNTEHGYKNPDNPSRFYQHRYFNFKFIEEGPNYILTSTYEYSHTDRIQNRLEDNKIILDFSKIEAINLRINKFDPDDKSFLLIYFKYAPGAKGTLESYDQIKKMNNVRSGNEIKFELGHSYDIPVCRELVKALNHLRKLHGAPEPISFD